MQIFKIAVANKWRADNQTKKYIQEDILKPQRNLFGGIRRYLSLCIYLNVCLKPEKQN